MIIDLAAELAKAEVVDPSEVDGRTVVRVDNLGGGVFIYHCIENGKVVRYAQAPAQMVMQALGLL